MVSSRRASRASKVIDLKEIIERLMEFDTRNTVNHVNLDATECMTICRMMAEKLSSTPVCITVKTPINIVGDLHGQFHDLLRIFDRLGQPPESRYLFLGDYVDRGKYSLEVIILLFALNLTYPDSVYLLRGNHESENTCRQYGFEKEVKELRFNGQSTVGGRVFASFVHTFKWLPLCAIVNEKFFCCHGGVSPSFLLGPYDRTAGQNANVSILNDIKRPINSDMAGVTCDLLWSDPAKKVPLAHFGPNDIQSAAKWVPSRRGCSFYFTQEALEEVMEVFGTQALIRGHQVADEGHECSLPGCITVFSAPGYCGGKNKGGVLQLHNILDNDSQISPSFITLEPITHDEETMKNLFWETEKAFM